MILRPAGLAGVLSMNMEGHDLGRHHHHYLFSTTRTDEGVNLNQRVDEGWTLMLQSTFQPQKTPLSSIMISNPLLNQTSLPNVSNSVN
jgi:hypothetical protein